MAQEAGTKLVGMGSPILGNKGTDEPKNTQIHKYTNTQTQIHMYKKLVDGDEIGDAGQQRLDG